MRSLILFYFVLSLLFSCKPKGDAVSGNVKENLSVEDFEAKLKSSVQLIDVRTPEEFSEGHLAKAININIGSPTWQTDVETLDKNKPVLVYCKSGARSEEAANSLTNLGFKVVYNLEGGIMKWQIEGKTVEKPEISSTSNGMSISDYNELVNSDKYVLVDFHAKWCGPCKALSPILEKIAKERVSTLILEKVDADKNQNLLIEKGIDGIPYLELYKNGKLVWKHQGFIEEEELLSSTGLK